ncbi:hypothetical protein [Cylindrospermum sp. FACHB-282]|uniref:hypothetical protein n=1 Tax=Cylindrospermum sp. FACHB-282 TaxID=2692794 RepID=UPI001686B7E4|nr:hypothetical protein [Cylindrospermum sp. FACHB-282]MBD2385252.1 hypothetical protein [Cylindrospermum sp. FACHB-282]
MLHFDRVLSNSRQLSSVGRRGFLTTLALGTLAAGSDSVQNHPPVMPATMPQPKFWFGQQVCFEWECDDDLDITNCGKSFRDYGVVVGMTYQQPGCDDGWVYWVKWEKLGADTVAKLPFTEAAHEDELQLA